MSVVWGGTYLRDVAGAGIVMGCGPQTIREYKLAPPEEVYDVDDDSILTTGVQGCELPSAVSLLQVSLICRL
jgi:hypothetical protein